MAPLPTLPSGWHIWIQSADFGLVKYPKGSGWRFVTILASDRVSPPFAIVWARPPQEDPDPAKEPAPCK